MKRALLLLCFLPWVLSASSQEPSDSLFWEVEDSVSSLAIKPVKKPKKLLNSIIDQLLLDLEKKPQVKNYMCEFVNVERISVPWTVRKTLSAKAGIRLETINTGEFRYEGPYKLTSKDSTFLSLPIDLSRYSPILENVDGISIDGEMSKSAIFKKLMQTFYDVKVYSITDNSGRGVYRVNYSPKKSQVTESNWEIMMYTYTGTAYFDSNTLRLTQVKAVRTRNKAPEGVSVFSITPISPLSPSAASLASSTYRKRYQIDYDGSGTKPIIKQIRIVVTEDNKVIAKTKVQKLN